MIIRTVTNETLITAIENLRMEKGDVLALFVGEDCTVDYLQLIEELNHADITFFGGIFPGVIHGSENLTNGCIVKKFKAAHAPIVISNLAEAEQQLITYQAIPEQTSIKCSVFTIVDGLTQHIGDFLNSLYNTFGNSVSFIGGGAGSLSLKPQRCLFSNEGFFQDAAVICFLRYEAKLSVKHGWQQLEGPIVATRTDRNTIYELNWQPAFEVYKEVVEHDLQKSGQEITSLKTSNFFDIAKGYPFGIYKENQEDIVRDPISVTDEGALVCVGEVPENTVLNILKGTADELIGAAELALQQTLEKAEHPNYLRHSLIVDCISRTLFLEKRFSEELEVINTHVKNMRAAVTPQGILSLGEISSYGENALEFFNKTIVVGSLYRTV
ncbi:MAG: FIST C-terminal domain-containing protein [Bacteroidota bacterium]